MNTITDRYDAEKMSYLPLPPAMKKQLLDMLFSPERQITDAVLDEYSIWMCPVDEELMWRPPTLKMESGVRVKILREMHFWSEKDIEREPVGWFHFEEAFKFNTLPEIFVQFIQLHLKKLYAARSLFLKLLSFSRTKRMNTETLIPKFQIG